MQRKDDLLISPKKMPYTKANMTTLGSTFSSRALFSSKKMPYAKAKRRGFAMIMAVIVMIVIATITMFTLMQTAQTVKRTADLYLYEQAQLHTKSAIEYALFKIAQDGCYQVLNFTLDKIYIITVNMRYVYTGVTTNVDGTINCSRQTVAPLDPYITINTNEQNGSVLMDIVVDVNSTSTGSDAIRYTRRTIQKL